jgi:RPA family protein
VGVSAAKTSIEQAVAGFEQDEDGSTTMVRGKKVFRVRLMGRVVGKFINDERSYGNVVLDDETGTIRAKFFSSNIHKLDGISMGDLVEVVGRIRQFQDEVHIITDEVAAFEDVNWELLRKLELAVPENGMEKEMLKKIRDGKNTEKELKKAFGDDAVEIVGVLMEKGEIYEVSPGEYVCVE